MGFLVPSGRRSCLNGSHLECIVFSLVNAVFHHLGCRLFNVYFGVEVIYSTAEKIKCVCVMTHAGNSLIICRKFITVKINLIVAK